MTSSVRITAIHQALNPVRQEIDRTPKTERTKVEDKDEEVLQITLPHAVCDPATVMVHAKDTPAALSAVVGPRWLYTLALLAVVHELLL